METEYTIEYDNDTGPNDEGFWECWTVGNDERSFRCGSKEDAEYLKEKLNALVCLPNERAFLDEIREKGEWVNSLKCLVIKKQDPNSNEQTGFVFQSDFKTPLEGLVNE